MNKAAFDTPFPVRLKTARKKLGLTQKQLGILAGIEECTASARMNQYEKNVHTPDFETLKKLARVLKVPTSYFYEQDDATAEVLLHYHSLNDEEKQQFKELLSSLSNSAE